MSLLILTYLSIMICQFSVSNLVQISNSEDYLSYLLLDFCPLSSQLPHLMLSINATPTILPLEHTPAFSPDFSAYNMFSLLATWPFSSFTSFRFLFGELLTGHLIKISHSILLRFQVPFSSSLFLFSVLYFLMHLLIYLVYFLLYYMINVRAGLFNFIYQLCSILYAQHLRGASETRCSIDVC